MRKLTLWVLLAILLGAASYVLILAAEYHEHTSMNDPDEHEAEVSRQWLAR